MRLYLDASPIIYAIQGEPALRASALAHIAAAEASAGGGLITSRLSRLECRIAPLRANDRPVLTAIDLLLTRPSVRVMDLTADVVDRARDLRARYRFRTPDALHFATALEAGADAFLTGDKELARCREIPVVLV